MRNALPGVLVLLAASAGAEAGELRVQVSDQRGRPVADAVVAVTSATGAAAPPAPAPKTQYINQVALAFSPYIEVFRPGDKVVFHNGDRTRHHVYSFSAAKTFEFMLNPGQDSTPLQLDRVGAIAVGCNIHDSMISFLYVTEAPWVGRTGPEGVATLALPDGRYTVRAWQPRLRPGRAEAVLENVSVAGAAPTSLAFKLALLPDTRRQPDRERARY